jgi:hypothetical protein
MPPTPGSSDSPGSSGSLPCCAACLHAIIEPERPILVQDRFFHLGHVPQPSLDAFPSFDAFSAGDGAN